jgi:hypothetical protein
MANAVRAGARGGSKAIVNPDVVAFFETARVGRLTPPERIIHAEAHRPRESSLVEAPSRR